MTINGQLNTETNSHVNLFPIRQDPSVSHFLAHERIWILDLANRLEKSYSDYT